MKKIILIGSLLFSTLCIQAQNTPNDEQIEKSNKVENKKPRKTPEERATILTEKIKTICGDLSPDQEAKVKAIFLKRAQKVNEIKSNEVSKDNRREELKLLFAQSKEELKTVLTATQFEKIKERKKEEKGKSSKK